jgi:hypothetical protein
MTGLSHEEEKDLDAIIDFSARVSELKKKFEPLDYLVLRDYNPDFPEKVSMELQEQLYAQSVCAKTR